MRGSDRCVVHTRTSPQQPPARPTSAELSQRVDATKKLLALHKRGHATPLVAAQEDPHAERPPIGELGQIAKLEVMLANLESYERLRLLTVGR